MIAVEVAVIIVSFRSAGPALRCLESLGSELTSPDVRIRVIVVDNASGDLASLARVAADRGWSAWLTLIGAPRNGGFAYGNNLGIAAAYAQGAPDFVYLLNPDAEVRAGAVSALVHFLRLHPDVGVAGSGIENADGSDWRVAFRFPSLWTELVAGLELHALKRWELAKEMQPVAQPVDWVCGASMMVRAALLATIGGLDENYFLYFEETDYCFRARQAGFSTWYVPEAKVMHTGGQSTQINARGLAPNRLPPYWFESRRRYFMLRVGLGRARMIDTVALAAHALALAKRAVRGRLSGATPHLIRDLFRHSVLRRSNREVRLIRGLGPESFEAHSPRVQTKSPAHPPLSSV